MTRCCPCRALEHGPRGCAFCWPPCKVTGDLHPAREEAEHFDAWMLAGLEAGDPMALWVDGWRCEEVAVDQRRPASMSGGAP